MKSYTQKPEATSRVIEAKPKVSRQADIKEILRTYNPNPVQKRDVVPISARQQGECGVLQRHPDVDGSLGIPVYQKPGTTTCWFLSILHGIYKAGWVKDLFVNKVIVKKTGENQYHCVEGGRTIDVVYAVDGRPLWQQILEGFINHDVAAMNTIVAGIDNETKATEKDEIAKKAQADEEAEINEVAKVAKKAQADEAVEAAKAAELAKAAKIAGTASPIFTTTTTDTTTTKPVEKTKTTKTGTKETGTTTTTIKTATATTTTTTTTITATYTAAAIITIVTDTATTATTATTTTTTTVTVAPPILPGSPSAAPVTTITPVTTTTPPVNSTKNELISSNLFSVKDQFSFDKINNVGGGIKRTPATIKAVLRVLLNMINKDWQIQDAQSISPLGATGEKSPFKQMVGKEYLSKLEEADQEILEVMTVEKKGHAMGVNSVGFSNKDLPAIQQPAEAKKNSAFKKVGVKISDLDVFNQSYVEGGASNATNVAEAFKEKNTQKYKDIIPGVAGNVLAEQQPGEAIPPWANPAEEKKQLSYINYYRLARAKPPVEPQPVVVGAGSVSEQIPEHVPK